MTNTTISKSIFLNAPRETVWLFLTDKDKLGDWYHPAQDDLSEGSDYTLIDGNEGSSPKPQVWGRVIEMTKPSKLVTTFNIAPFQGVETTVTWILEEIAGGTRLSLKHEGIAEASGTAMMHLLTALDDGWDRHLNQLSQTTKL